MGRGYGHIHLFINPQTGCNHTPYLQKFFITIFFRLFYVHLFLFKNRRKKRNRWIGSMKCKENYVLNSIRSVFFNDSKTPWAPGSVYSSNPGHFASCAPDTPHSVQILRLLCLECEEPAQEWTLVGTQFAKSPDKLFYYSSKYLNIRKHWILVLKSKIQQKLFTNSDSFLQFKKNSPDTFKKDLQFTFISAFM